MVVPKFVKVLLARTGCAPAIRSIDSTSSGRSGWELLRRAEVESDRSLMDLSHRLLRAMPAYAIPRLLCERYPRIVNRLAVVWTDPARFECYIDSLLIDRRGNRQGFAPSVRAELVRLSFFYAKLKADPGALSKWKEELQ